MDLNDNKYIKLPDYSPKECAAALRIIKDKKMSGLDVTEKFESDFACYNNTKYALACANGTAAMLEALWACGVNSKSEVIAPSMTYWASVFPAKTLGAKIKYVDIDPQTLCLSIKDLKKGITANTKVIIVVHMYGYPLDVSQVLDIARQHNILVVEDFSHAHGALNKGRKCGSMGDIGIASLMTEKPFPVGEGGIICTNNQTLYERCCVFGHYRYLGCYEDGHLKLGKVYDKALLQFAGAPIGGVKNRMNQIAAAIGIERLKIFDEQIKEANKAINYFIDLLEIEKVACGHRISGARNSMGGWYMPKIFVSGNANEIADRICKLGYFCYAGHKYYNLVDHPLSRDFDFIRCNSQEELLRHSCKHVPAKEMRNINITNDKLLSIPRFSIYNRKVIEKYAYLYIKAITG